VKEVKIHPVGELTCTFIWLNELASWGFLHGAAFYPKETKLPFGMKVVCLSAPMMKRELLPEWLMGF
jgi:hypothetical protein